MGPRVSKIKTAKCIPAKAEVFQYFQGHHLSLELFDKANLTEADIEARLRAAGGAHQPSDMQFPGGGHELKVVKDVPVSEAPAEESPRTAAAATSSAAAAAPAPAKLSPTSSFSSHGGGGSGGGGSSSSSAAASAAAAKTAAQVARAGEEAAAAALAIGKAAARLGELLKAAEGGQVSVAELESLVAGELATASLRAAATVAVIAEAK